MSQEHPSVAGGACGPEEVLSYWFPKDINEADIRTLQRQGKRWMAGGPEVDREITERFGEVLERARRGELDHWADTPRGRLALIIVLDQFSRNIYRGSPLSYSQDEKVLKLALEGIDLGMDRELGAVERLFLAPPWPLGGPCPPRAWRPPRRGGSGKRAAPPEGDGRVRRLSSQSRPPRHSALRASPAPQRDTRAYLHAGGARVPEDRNAATLASASFLLRPYSPECVEDEFFRSSLKSIEDHPFGGYARTHPGARCLWWEGNSL